jgi:hypothetical protein
MRLSGSQIKPPSGWISMGLRQVVSAHINLACYRRRNQGAAAFLQQFDGSVSLGEGVADFGFEVEFGVWGSC